MNNGKMISVRYSADELKRLEAAAMLADYKHLATYIRDMSLEKIVGKKGGRGGVDSWSETQEFTLRLAHLERVQKVTTTLLATLTYLANQKISPDDLHAAMQDATGVSAALVKLAPELQQLIDHLHAE